MHSRYSCFSDSFIQQLRWMMFSFDKDILHCVHFLHSITSPLCCGFFLLFLKVDVKLFTLWNYFQNAILSFTANSASNFFAMHFTRIANICLQFRWATLRHNLKMKNHNTFYFVELVSRYELYRRHSVCIFKEHFRKQIWWKFA